MESEAGRGGPGHPQDQGADDTGPGTGGAGNNGQDLEEADANGVQIGNVLQGFHPGLPPPVPVFHQQEAHAVEDQGAGDHRGCGKMGFDVVVQQDGGHGAGDAGHNDLQPEGDGLLLQADPALGRSAKGPELVPEQDHHRQDGAQLDHYEEHLLEGLGGVDLQEFVHQQHMAGRTHRKPFGYTLDNAEEDDLQ